MKKDDKKLSTLKKESKFLNVKLNKKMYEDKENMIGRKCKLTLAFDSLFVDNAEQHYLRP